MSVALLFPGQGAQAVGMGKDVYDASAAAREVFRRAEKEVGIDLARLCFEGPAERLNRTDMAQPAILTVSVALLEMLRERLGERMIQADVTAGLSLGEYTALHEAGAMDFETALKLVVERGRCMQDAAEQSDSGMLSVMGLDETAAGELCAEARGEGEVLVCANFNCPGQIVLSGHRSAIQRAGQLAEGHGAGGTVELAVAGAFHSELMAPAADRLSASLASAALNEPRVPVIANVDAQPHGTVADVRAKLLRQLVAPVRWQASMEKLLADGVETFYEVGPGRVLAGLMRRIDRKTKVTSVNSAQAIEKLTG
jgi:[acyl-carrier-protein] S-malonyltransferase